MKFNKKQLAYLDKLVQESPTRMILTQNLYDRYSFVDEEVAKLGRVWENQLTEYRYETLSYKRLSSAWEVVGHRGDYVSAA